MPPFRRERDPDADRIRSAFAAVATHVDAAQRALLAAIPTSRDPGIPLAQALAGLGTHLADAEAAMPGWLGPATRAGWEACDAALTSARAEAERLRLEPDGLGFEALNARVGDVLHPLETFADAERAIRRL
jgi:hypothetical protein